MKKKELTPGMMVLNMKSCRYGWVRAHEKYPYRLRKAHRDFVAVRTGDKHYRYPYWRVDHLKRMG